jgi:hypothetical protein
MSNAEIVKMLKTMAKDIEQNKDNITALLELVNDMKVVDESILDTCKKTEATNILLNAKFDIVKNLDLESRENIEEKKNEKKPTKPSFFKTIFLNEKDKYMNTLYTQDEIDAIYAGDEVSKKKKDADKATKAAALLYANHIKADNPEGRFSAFESIYSQFYA